MNPLLNTQASLNLVSTVVNQAIVQPLGNPYTIGISGLIFDIVDVVDLNIESDITDHYIEQNYAIQDHIAKKPVIITLKGFAAEKVAIFQPNILNTIFTAALGLVPLKGIGPSYNIQDGQFYTQLAKLSQQTLNIANSVLSVFQIFNNSATMVTRQQTVFNFLYGLWKSRTLCTVETPFGIFNNMAIMSLRPSQNGESVYVSEFYVTFKQILTVDSIIGTINVNSTQTQNTGSLSNDPPVGGGAFQEIISNPVNLGNDTGSSLDTSGNEFTVASVSQNIYTQQAQPTINLPGDFGPQ